MHKILIGFGKVDVEENNCIEKNKKSGCDSDSCSAAKYLYEWKLKS